MCPRNLCNLHYKMIYCMNTRQKDHIYSCVKIWRSVFFVIAPVWFLRSCHSLEAETWRRTASLALSATDKYWVIDIHICIYIYIYIYICVCMCVCVCNKSRHFWKWNEISPILIFHNISEVCRNMWIARVSDFVTSLGDSCNYVYSLTRYLLYVIFIPFFHGL
jgi:hypothetical protein